MGLIKNNKLIYINLAILLLCCTIKSGYDLTFNGLPWTNKYELFLFLIVLPLLLFLNTNFIKKISVFFILLIILLSKLLLISDEKVGIGHNYFIENDINKIENYNIFWNNKYSAVQEYNWTNKENFELDWINFNEGFFPQLGKTVKESLKYKELSLKINSIFFLKIDKESDFIIQIQGVDNINKIKLENVKNLEEQEVYFKDNKIFFKKLNKGIYKYTSSIKFSGENWRFVPQIINDNKILSALNSKNIFLEYKGSFSKFKIYLSFLCEFLFVLFVIIWFFDLFKNTINFNNFKSILLFNSLVFPLYFFLKTILFYTQNQINIIPLEMINLSEYFSLSLIILFIIIILFYDNFIKKLSIIDCLYNDTFRSLILIISPIFFYYWSNFYLQEIQGTSFWSYGDDWHTFQEFSRKIVTDKDWLHGGENGVFYFRPGIRYFFAIMHILFGQSGIAIKLFEAFIILISFLLILKILLILEVNKFLAISFSLLVMFFYLGDSFRLLISRGLSEYYTLLLLLLMIIISLNNNIRKYSFIIILSILGIFLSWIREEKLLTAISVMFLFIHIKDLNYNNPIIGIFSKLKVNFKINLVFLIILITGFPILFEVRNFIVAENSTIATHPSVLKISFDSYYKIIFGSEFGSFPKPFSIFVILSLFIILNTIFFKKINRLMPYFGISIIYLSLVIPFILLEIPGYVPRHSISIFAISLLILGIFVNNYLKKNNYINKYFNRAK